MYMLTERIDGGDVLGGIEEVRGKADIDRNDGNSETFFDDTMNGDDGAVDRAIDELPNPFENGVCGEDGNVLRAEVDERIFAGDMEHSM